MGNTPCFDDVHPPNKVDAQSKTHACAHFELFTCSKMLHVQSELEFCRPKQHSGVGEQRSGKCVAWPMTKDSV